MRRRALLSVYDKRGIVDFGQMLHGMGWLLVASGGTARTLRAAGIPIQDVAQVTGAPEMLGGRVKTLHPAIHGGILARDLPNDRQELADQGITMIDLVACNLYPFQETIAQPGIEVAEAVEQIDIGGVTLLRAAAKNFARVMVVSDPADYSAVLAQIADNIDDLSLRHSLAIKAFAHTRDYDTAITAFLEKRLVDFSNTSGV